MYSTAGRRRHYRRDLHAKIGDRGAGGRVCTASRKKPRGSRATHGETRIKLIVPLLAQLNQPGEITGDLVCQQGLITASEDGERLVAVVSADEPMMGSQLFQFQRNRPVTVNPVFGENIGFPFSVFISGKTSLEGPLRPELNALLAVLGPANFGNRFKTNAVVKGGGTGPDQEPFVSLFHSSMVNQPPRDFCPIVNQTLKKFRINYQFAGKCEKRRYLAIGDERGFRFKSLVLIQQLCLVAVLSPRRQTRR